MATTMTLIAIRKYAQQIMADHGFADVPFKWDNGSRRAGSVQWLHSDPRGTAKLTLSRKLIPTFSDAAIRNTILHEVAHLMTIGHGHDEVWRAAAIAIGCDGERCYEPHEARRLAGETSSFERA